MQRVWSTDDVAPADRQAYWREVVCGTFVNLDVRPSLHDARFDGRVGASGLGPVRVCFIDAHPMDVVRTDRHIAKVREDDLLVGLHVRGLARGTQDGRSTNLTQGTFALFDATRPYRVDFAGRDRFVHVVIQFPRAMLERRVGATHALTARAAGGSGGTGASAARFILELSQRAPRITGSESARLGDDVIDLVALALEPRAEVASPDRVLWRWIGDHVSRHLSDPALSPETIAVAHHISTRTLYNLFASQAGMPVTAWIQRQRFLAIRRDLRDPRHDQLSVAQIGHRHGVCNAAYLSRSYRSRFGWSPSAERASRGATSRDRRADSRHDGDHLAQREAGEEPEEGSDG